MPKSLTENYGAKETRQRITRHIERMEKSDAILLPGSGTGRAYICALDLKLFIKSMAYRQDAAPGGLGRKKKGQS